MNESAQDQMIDLFDRMIEKTLERKIIWRQVSASVFKTSIETKSLTIQRARKASLPSQKPTYDYQLTISNPLGSEGMGIDTSDRRYLTNVLAELWDAAEESVDLETVKVLKDLLGDS